METRANGIATRDRCDSTLNRWILPRWRGRRRWGRYATVAVEQWLRSIPRANGTKAKIRNTMSALFNHAIRWEFTASNPITGPVRGSGVRQSAKRERIATGIRKPLNFNAHRSELSLREQVMVWLCMTTGLRRGELAGLRWSDISFEALTINVVRSVVDQKVGKVKTEASQKPVPLDAYVANDLLAWYSAAEYVKPEDYVFSSSASRAGKHRGKQPLWLAKVMQYHIHPAAERAGIVGTIGWHTFRHSRTQLCCTPTAKA